MKELIEDKRVVKKIQKKYRTPFELSFIAKARFEPYEYRLVCGDYLLYHAEMTHYRLLNQPIY